MLKVKSAGAVERERERESYISKNGKSGFVQQPDTHTQVVLNNIFLIINSRNKDPCCGLRLMYLRI